MPAHKCHADGCQVSVPPKMLMCLMHWRMVPGNMKRAVWATYRPGQERDKNPTREYLAAAQAAIQAVYEQEHAADVKAEAEQASLFGEERAGRAIKGRGQAARARRGKGR